MTIAIAPRSKPSAEAGLTLARSLGTVALTLVFGASCGEPAAPDYSGPYRHVLFITMDTLRADHLGCYGDTRGLSPRLDALAAAGVRFDQPMAAASSTLASHTSMMTGLYPRRHGVARNGFAVNKDNVMLAEVLGQAGFHTAGFIGSFALDEVFDFDQGFDHWDQAFDIEFDIEHADQNQRRAQRVTDAVLAHVDEVKDAERLFLFAHYFDVHAPFDPPEPFASKHALPGAIKTSSLTDVNRQEAQHQLRIGAQRRVFDVGVSLELAQGADGTKLPGDDELAALYAGELAYLDSQVGRLLDGLAERGVLEHCIVIVTADHGETFWEHGDFWHHGAWVYETNVHVPLIVQLPGGRGRGRVPQRPVSSVDLFPTLLDLLELPLPESVHGVSLVGTIDGQELPLRDLFAEATQPTRLDGTEFEWENQLKSKCIRRGRWKYIQTPYLKFEELYDIESDPGERRNLMKELNDETRPVFHSLRDSLDKWRVIENPRDSAFNPTQMESVLRRLKELGYTGGADDEAETGE